MRNRLLRALVGVLMLAACSSNGPSTATKTLHGIPVVEGSTQPPGTKLRNGFTVAPGASLIADVFPIGVEVSFNNRDIEDRGWRAFLLVTGDPHAVVRHYQAEAQRVGLPLAAQHPSEPACGNDASEGYICNVVGGRRVGSRYRSFWLSLRRQEKPGQVPLSFASLRYSDSEVGAPVTARGPELDLGPPAPPLAQQWPGLPRPGEGLAAGLGRGDRVTIELGSRAIAPVLANNEATDRQSPVVLLRIDGDPKTVLTRYRRQFLRFVGSDNDPRTGVQWRTDDGVRVLMVNMADQRTRYAVTATQRRGRPTWAYLTTAYGS